MSGKFKVSMKHFFFLKLTIHSPHFVWVSSVMVGNLSTKRLTLAAVSQLNPLAVSASTKYLEHTAMFFSSPRTETISNYDVLTFPRINEMSKEDVSCSGCLIILVRC